MDRRGQAFERGAARPLGRQAHDQSADRHDCGHPHFCGRWRRECPAGRYPQADRHAGRLRVASGDDGGGREFGLDAAEKDSETGYFDGVFIETYFDARPGRQRIDVIAAGLADWAFSGHRGLNAERRHVIGDQRALPESQF